MFTLAYLSMKSIVAVLLLALVATAIAAPTKEKAHHEDKVWNMC